MGKLFFERDNFEGNSEAYRFVYSRITPEWQILGQIRGNTPACGEIFEICRHLAQEGVIEEKYCSERHSRDWRSWFEWRTKQ